MISQHERRRDKALLHNWTQRSNSMENGKSQSFLPAILSYDVAQQNWRVKKSSFIFFLFSFQNNSRIATTFSLLLSFLNQKKKLREVSISMDIFVENNQFGAVIFSSFFLVIQRKALETIVELKSVMKRVESSFELSP